MRPLDIEGRLKNLQCLINALKLLRRFIVVIF